jgi:hypothetical protein
MILDDDSTQVEFAMRWRDFNRLHQATQKFDAPPIPSAALTPHPGRWYNIGEGFPISDL